MAGPRTTAQMPVGNTLANAGQWGTAAELAAGTQALIGAQTGLSATGAGSQAAMLAAQNLGLDGATALTADALAANVAGNTAAQTTTATYGAGWLAAPAIMVAALKWLDSVNWGKGGASESAKLGKMQSEITRGLQADPSGNTTKQFIDSIITNKQWAGEANQDELGTLFKAGMVSLDTFPTLHSSESIVDLWNYDLSNFSGRPSDDEMADYRTRTAYTEQVRHHAIGPQAIAATYGLTREQQQQYESMITAVAQAEDRLEGGGQDGEGWRGAAEARRNRDALSAAQSALDQFKSTYLTEPRKKMYASALYDNLRSTGYQGDLSKLQRYLGV